MVDEFIAQGGTYFDTAYVYHEGNSEKIVKKALVERYPREAFTLATKLPAWELKSIEDVERIFEEQLERTGAGYFDYYLLHSIEKNHAPVYEKYDCYKWALEKKAQGLIKHVGFSFHEKADFLEEILEKYPEMEFVQLQINYLDWGNDNVQSRACYEVAVKHNIPVIVMEPVKGGTLAELPEIAEAVLKDMDDSVSIASWAMRFCGSLDNVKMILSGMSNMEQVKDNLKTMVDFKPLSKEESDGIWKTAETYFSIPTVQCTACKYCVPGCPANIQIPDMIKALNTSKLYGKNQRAVEMHDKFAGEGALASTCVECGQCEGVCPQHLNIIEILKEIAEVFEA